MLLPITIPVSGGSEGEDLALHPSHWHRRWALADGHAPLVVGNSTYPHIGLPNSETIRPIRVSEGT